MIFINRTSPCTRVRLAAYATNFRFKTAISSGRSSESSQVKTVFLRKSFSRGILSTTTRSFCSFSVATLNSWCYIRSRHFLCNSRPAVPSTLLSGSAHGLRWTKPYAPHPNSCLKKLITWWML